jgi:hypothetical protein
MFEYHIPRTLNLPIRKKSAIGITPLGKDYLRINVSLLIFQDMGHELFHLLFPSSTLD